MPFSPQIFISECAIRQFARRTKERIETEWKQKFANKHVSFSRTLNENEPILLFFSQGTLNTQNSLHILRSSTLANSGISSVSHVLSRLNVATRLTAPTLRDNIEHKYFWIEFSCCRWKFFQNKLSSTLAFVSVHCTVFAARTYVYSFLSLTYSQSFCMYVCYTRIYVYGEFSQSNKSWLKYMDNAEADYIVCMRVSGVCMYILMVLENCLCVRVWVWASTLYSTSNE